MFKNIIKLIETPISFYILVFLIITNIFGYISNNDYNSSIILIVSGILVYKIYNSVNIAMLLSLVVGAFYKIFLNNKEGYTEGHSYASAASSLADHHNGNLNNNMHTTTNNESSDNDSEADSEADGEADSDDDNDENNTNDSTTTNTNDASTTNQTESQTETTNNVERVTTNTSITDGSIVSCPQYNYLLSKNQVESLLNNINLYHFNTPASASSSTAVKQTIINNIIKDFFKSRDKRQLCYFISYMIDKQNVRVVNRSVEAHLKYLGEEVDGVSNYNNNENEIKAANAAGQRAGSIFKTFMDGFMQGSEQTN